MAEHVGIVINSEPGGTALVVTDRKGGCGGCRSTPSGCRSCLAGSKIESRVANPVNAQTGDIVNIRLSTKDLFSGASIIYLLPVFCLLAGAVTGFWSAAILGVTDTAGAIGGAIVGLCTGYAGVIKIDRSVGMRRRMLPTITRVMRSDK